MSPQRPRQQRRSACNRCRTYKLRCERDPRQADGSCERCRKTGAECITATAMTTTTASASSSSSSSSSPASARLDPGSVHAKDDFGNNIRVISRLAPAPAPLRPHGEREESLRPGSRDLPMSMSMQAQREMQPTGRPTQARSEEANASAYSQAGMLDVGNQVRISSHALVCQEARPGPDKPHNGGRREDFTASSLSDVAVFDGSYMDLMSPSADPLLQELGLAHPENGPTPKQSVHDWRGSLATSLSPTEVAGFDDSYVDLVSLRSHNDSDGDGGVDVVSRNYLCDVLELSRQLAEDHESLQTADVYPPYADNAPNPVEAAVQRAVDRSSQLCELLKSIAARRPTSATSPSRPRSSCPGRRRRGNPKNACCVVLATSLVTAYILLVRNWRLIFVHLHRLLLIRPPPPGEANGGGGFAILPSLQLGGFRRAYAGRRGGGGVLSPVIGIFSSLFGAIMASIGGFFALFFGGGGSNSGHEDIPMENLRARRRDAQLYNGNSLNFERAREEEDDNKENTR
ncbi:hypothetical protein CHU98_g1802 [Xylaria longipes]|nr:hypothetical protein CHU98_g1802 [Xylaria longipes]